MKDEKKAPKLRFKGFTDDWEQCKLGDLADRVTTKNKGMVSELPLTISAQDGLISQDEFFNKKVASKDLSSYLLLHHGDFAYNKSYSNGYPFGTIKRLEKYPQGVVSSLYIAFKPNSSISSDFMAQYYESNNWHKEIYKCAAEGARNHGLLNVPPSDFFATNLNIPITKSEQLKIGRLLNAVDQTITLHEEKKHQLERLKSALLQKMFADKSGYPDIRFEGFSDEWEQCKLSDISEKSYEKNTDNKYSTVFTNSAEHGIVKQRDFFDKDIANSSNISGYYVVRKNYFVYNPRISNQAKFGPINRNKLDESGIMSPLYLVFTVHDIDESFLETLFQTTTWHRFMYQNGDTGARADRFAIKDSTFMSMPIKVPSLEEQHKLALA
ncbi:restriction endonuclease subunit S, partial [Lactobacillus delbrueckii subsp. bulgaricus]|nr:type I restriction endonuclease subunit S [Lactobacillus delbrueckii subsp. bulgaricus]